MTNTHQAPELQGDNERLSEELEKLKHVRKHMSKNAALLQAIHQAQSKFIGNHTAKDVFDNLLAVLLELTESEYGFIGEVLYTDGTPHLKTYAITNIAWNDETRQFYSENAPSGFEFTNLKSLFGEVMTTGAVVIANQPSNDSRSGGLPEGHPSLDHFLGLPFFNGNKLNGMVGIANRPNGYDTPIIEYLQPFLSTCSNIVQAIHIERDRKNTEIELAVQNEEKVAQALELVEANKKTQRVLERFNDLVNATDGIVWEADAVTFDFISISHNSERILGYPVADWLQPNFWVDHIHPDDRDQAIQYCAACTGRAEDHNFDYRFIAADGQVVWLRDMVRVVVEGSQPRWLRGLMVDISENKLAEEALRTSEERYTLAVKGAHDGLWDWNIQMEEGYLSPRGKEMLGYQEHEFDDYRKYFADAVHPEDHDRVAEAVKVHFQSRTPYDLEYRLRHKGGSYIWVHAKGQATWDDDGRAIRMAGSINDITERKAINDQLRRAQKMEAVGQLTGGIAHDFNNILAIIMGNLEMLQLTLSSDEAALSSVSGALKGVNRGTEIIDRLLGFARMNVDRVSLASMNIFIEDMEDLLAKALTVSISIEYHLAPDLWPVSVNTGDLEDAILNLSLNARDAMPNGGRLSIVTANKVLEEDFVRLQPEAKIGEYAMLSVSDNGIGMLPEVREKVLEPFFTTKAKDKGTGLGLSMVYGFVKRSGGFVIIDSEPDIGTSMKLFLPRERRTEQVDSSTTDKEELPRGDETVLVVDDEEELARIAAATLESLGYTVLTAFGGESALALLKDKPNIDLLFSDVIMPGELDGYLLSIAAKKAHPALKILLTSGFSRRKECGSRQENSMIEELRRSLLSKPYSKARLALAIRNALD